MYRQIDITALLEAIKKKVETCTALSCYDAVPRNAPAPFYAMELVMSRPADSKTFYRQAYTVNIYSIAQASPSTAPVLHLVRRLEEALTEDIELPCGFILESQVNNGVMAIGTDESGEKRATNTYTFIIRYGVKRKC